tara:strand:- start:54 stop:659 length:606 start_codon:yes stop_codon:yes gene_type:complete
LLEADLFINFDSYYIVAVCYLIGSIPFGLLISKLLKKNDPRLHGSKNIGATNILRTSGWKLGLLTLIFDILKGYFPIIILKNFDLSLNIFILFIFLGHLFPIWIKFKGGKGIAVIIGCLIAYNFQYGIFFMSTWLLVASITRYSSLAALISSLCTLLLFYIKSDDLFSAMIIIVLMIFYKHFSNIKRLLGGKESKIILKNK